MVLPFTSGWLLVFYSIIQCWIVITLALVGWGHVHTTVVAGLHPWLVSTLPWSLMGDTRREDCVDDFLNFSVEEASLWDFPLWIFKPFSVLKLDSQWSHWKASSCVTVFWLDSKPVEEAASYWDFFIKNTCLRLAFLLRADGLFLLLAGMVFLPSLVSKEKVKVGPMVRENRKSLPWLVEVHAFGGQGGFLFTWGSNHSWELLLNYEKTEDQLIRHVVSSEIIIIHFDWQGLSCLLSTKSDLAIGWISTRTSPFVLLLLFGQHQLVIQDLRDAFDLR